MPDIPIQVWIVIVPAIIVAIQKYWDLQNQRTIKRMDAENKRDSDEKAAQHARETSALQVQLEQMRQEQALRMNAESDDTRMRAELTKHWHDALDLADTYRNQRDNIQAALLTLQDECVRAIAAKRPPALARVITRGLPPSPQYSRRQDPPLDPDPSDNADENGGGAVVDIEMAPRPPVPVPTTTTQPTAH